MSGYGIKIDGDQHDIIPAEVVHVNYKDDIPTEIYNINCKPILQDSSNKSGFLITARPINYNIKRLPLVGEVVILMRGPQAGSSKYRPSSEYYYLDSYSIQSSLHQNSLPKTSYGDVDVNSEITTGYENASLGITKLEQEEEENELHNSIQEKNDIQPKQPYAGDLLIEGRFGQSIRMSSTILNTNDYNIPPTWTKGISNENDPIIIISNGQINDIEKDIPNKFWNEDINKDRTSIYMTNGQSIPFQSPTVNFEGASKHSINKFNSDDTSGDQIILNAYDRLLLISRQKEIGIISNGGILLSSNKAFTVDVDGEIELNSKERINIGLNADEPLLLGDTVGDWLVELLTQLQSLCNTLSSEIHPTGVGPSGPPIQAPVYANISGQLAKLQSQVPTLKSLLAYTKRSN